MNKEEIKKILEKYKDVVNKITIFDDDYPKELLELKNPPIILFYKGNKNLLKSKDKISIVGSRKPCDYAIRVTVAVCEELNKKEFVIVSGGALGIDAIAHQNAKQTIMVLGCGIDYVYPKENKKLFEKVEKEGLIISEYPFDAKPESKNFLERNRIVAALANEIYVMELTKISGTINTVNHAKELGKTINVLPVSVFKKELYNNNLISEGARIISLKR